MNVVAWKMRGEISLGKVSTFDEILRVVGDFAKLT
jgi:hypothetical protein